MPRTTKSRAGHTVAISKAATYELLYWIASGTVKRARIRHSSAFWDGLASQTTKCLLHKGVREDTVVLSGINKAAVQAYCTGAQGLTWGSPTCKRVLSSAMVHFVGPRQILPLTLTVAILGLTAASHFRGGTIQWKPLDPVHFTGEVSAICYKVCRPIKFLTVTIQ